MILIQSWVKTVTKIGQHWPGPLLSWNWVKSESKIGQTSVKTKSKAILTFVSVCFFLLSKVKNVSACYRMLFPFFERLDFPPICLVFSFPPFCSHWLVSFPCSRNKWEDFWSLKYEWFHTWSVSSVILSHKDKTRTAAQQRLDTQS